ncbi:uncharacterized protein LOC121392011 [Gigantopelta aegis]|uniref:uncharacterized protein LOC121392011 n=1 Tax=Gigantopelta aegis TaxID=1735272 RepID=UPI001B888A4E|nr:uncharacterized protein LOC121392011 [Gigantopelta aegis]
MICSLSSEDQGNPEATFHWIRNSNTIEHTGFNYTFTPSKEDNGDEYKCTAGNLLTDRDGQSRPKSNAVQLNVYYSPRVVISSRKHTRVELGKLLILRCSADSNPATPTFEWTRGTTHVADGPVLLIAAFRDSDQGEYTCSAKTVSPRYGSLTGAASVIVTVLEAAPDSCYCTDQSETSVDLEWNYDRTDKSNRFSVEQRLSKNSRWDLVSMLPTQRENNTFIVHVDHLQSNSSYYFKIFSSSTKDDSSFCLTTCRTLPFSKTHEPVLESSTSGLGVGVAVGLVVGLVVTSVAAVLINIILLRKGVLVRSECKRQKETSVYQDITMDTVQQTSGSDTTRVPNESTNAYESLQSHDATPYGKLNAYGNLPPSGEMFETTIQ